MENNTIKKIIVMISSSIFILVILVLIVLIFEWKKGNDEIKRISLQEEKMVLRDVSTRTGREFADWLELREYVYCDLLKKGMTRDEAEAALSTIGEVRFPGVQADYKNKYLFLHLSPLILHFSEEYPKRLTYWEYSPEFYPAALKAQCEIEKINN